MSQFEWFKTPFSYLNAKLHFVIEKCDIFKNSKSFWNGSIPVALIGTNTWVVYKFSQNVASSLVKMPKMAKSGRR